MVRRIARKLGTGKSGTIAGRAASGRMYQYVNFPSWLAMNASNCTAAISAYARAARGGFLSGPSSNIHLST